MPIVKELYVYPIKSLGGISLSNVKVTSRGFQYDRRWMLVDNNNVFLTQRSLHVMAMLQVAITDHALKVFHKNNIEYSIDVPLKTHNSNVVKVKVWDDVCDALEVDTTISTWFTQQLQVPCKLVYMPDNSRRLVDKKYAISDNDITSFSDGYPLLMISNESLTDLNNRMDTPLPMNRFRPNLVIEQVRPYQEDDMHSFEINNTLFYGVKPCSRCVVTTINQDTLQMSKEPLKTLANYRRKDNNIYFGQNVIPASETTLNIGDTIYIHKN
jgi:uncharacterized protein